MKKYAYVRVSTKEQNIDRQILALESYKTLNGQPIKNSLEN